MSPGRRLRFLVHGTTSGDSERWEEVGEDGALDGGRDSGSDSPSYGSVPGKDSSETALSAGEGGPVEYGDSGGRKVGEAGGMMPGDGGSCSNGLVHSGTSKLGAEDKGDSVG